MINAPAFSSLKVSASMPLARGVEAALMTVSGLTAFLRKYTLVERFALTLPP